MTKRPVIDATATLRNGGKTFWLSSLFLPREVAADAAILYAFCRKMDDLADQQSGSEVRKLLEQVQKDLHTRRSKEPVVVKFLELAERRQLDLRAAQCLLEVLHQDAAGGTRIEDESELLRYCYGAAGTVGLMMSVILHASSALAKMQAIDLGIAMQLTNIARDVQEDALMGRRYLPSDWVHGLGPEQIGAALNGTDIFNLVKPGIEKILVMADTFYLSGAQGFSAIPSSSRKGIRIAAAAYRHIGVDLRRRGCDFTTGRTVISLTAKLRIAAGVWAGHSDLELLTCVGNVNAYHRALAGLPGVA